MIDVLLIEDNDGDAVLIRETLATARDTSFAIHHATRLSEGLARLRQSDIDVVLLDLMLPDGHGLETLSQLQAVAPHVPVVVLTGLEDEAALRLSAEGEPPEASSMVASAFEMGVQDYLIKDHVNYEGLIRTLRYAIERKRSRERLRRYAKEQEALREENARLYREIKSMLEEREQAQAQLVMTEKMAALGRLAASLAHEINNPLQALRSGFRLLLNPNIAPAKRQRYLEVANREIERLIAIVERMLGFYRPSSERAKPTDINTVLQETLLLVGKKLEHAGVRVQQRLTPHLPLVTARADQLTQVFLNLILNAQQAMPDGGVLQVTTRCDAERRVVSVLFRDTGVGIPRDRLPQLFEPLFTMRLGGLGLGLAISYSIVEQHGGSITVESEVGRGSTFTVNLPVEGAQVDLSTAWEWR